MTAMINTGDKSLDRMYSTFGIDAVKWSQISTFWVDKITTDLELGSRFTKMCEEEMERLEKGVGS